MAKAREPGLLEETKGFLRAWLIQLPLDFLVFAFWFLEAMAK